MSEARLTSPPRGRRGGAASLLTVKAFQKRLVQAGEELDTALLQARRDGWSLRELAEEIGLSYSSVKRYSLRAQARGQ